MLGKVTMITLFKDIHIAKLKEIVAVIIVCDVDLVVLSQGVFHPSPFISTEFIVCYRL